jgi:hypothetical protein
MSNLKISKTQNSFLIQLIFSLKQIPALKTAWKNVLIFIFFNIVILKADASQPNYSSEIISPNLKTVQFHRHGWPLSHPIIRLNSDQTLLLTFDELGTAVKNYYYTITLCTVDWHESDLMTTEYLKGNPLNPLNDYTFSFNTTFDYLHYKLLLPNGDVAPSVSGNYVVKVFEMDQPNNPVLVKKFMVVEPIVTIKSAIRSTASSTIRASHHEIDFEILHPGFTIHNPIEEISVTIMQNGRTDNLITGLKPLFIRDGLMDFNYNRENLMEGGNEFRYIDLRSTRYLSDRVKTMEYLDPFYHALVTPDFPRPKFSYQYRKDLNGRLYIEVSERENPDIEGDYVFTHFTLKPENPSPFQKIYLNGAITNWEISPTSEMIFNPENNCYEKILLLKQGYYNYQFLVLENGKTTLAPIEGNFEQTENDYLIFVYYKAIGDRNHRLIGADVINSVLTQQQTPE